MSGLNPLIVSVQDLGSGRPSIDKERASLPRLTPRTDTSISLLIITYMARGQALTDSLHVSPYRAVEHAMKAT
jgi:hypothetical protein